MSITLLHNRFGGVQNDPRADGSGCRMVTNFDITTSAKRLMPYRNSEDGDSSASTSKKQNFEIAIRTGSTYSFYALGVKSGTATAEVLYKNLTTGASTDLSEATWAATTNNQSAGGSTSFNLFKYYKKTGLIYGAAGGQYIWAYDPSGSAAFADTHRDLTSFTNIAQGLVHSKDDILYVPYDNKIAKNDNGSWTNAAVTLPSHLYITSIAEYGNYIAIACAPLSRLGSSVVFLWDRDSTLATLAESIDWGSGILQVLEEVNGILIGISITGGDSTRFKDRITFRYYAGTGGAQLLDTLESESTSFQGKLPIAKQKIDQRIYFMMALYKNGAMREGVWSIGKSPDGAYAIVHERTPSNDTALTGAAALKNFYFVGDFLFQSYQETNFALTKTDDQANFTATSIYESKINPEIPKQYESQLLKLIAVGAIYDALPTAGQVVVKHRIPGGTYKTIFTETTDAAIYTEPVGLYGSDGTQFNDLTKEHEFRIESTGGAVVAGLLFKLDTKESNA